MIFSGKIFLNRAYLLRIVKKPEAHPLSCGLSRAGRQKFHSDGCFRSSIVLAHLSIEFLFHERSFFGKFFSNKRLEFFRILDTTSLA
jgi:hypothetical protein